MSALLISKGLDLARKVPPSRPLRKAKRGKTASGNLIGAEKRLPRECCLAAHQVNDQHANQRRDNARNAQRPIGHFQHGRHRPFGPARKRREKDSLDRKEQAERGKEIVHLGNRPPYLAAADAGPEAAPACAFPDGSPK